MEENVIQIKSKITINVDASVKNIIYVEKDIWNPTTSSCENVKHLASVIDDSMNTCDEIKEETKTAPTNFNVKKVTCKTQNVYILLEFLLTTIALLIAVSIYCYLIKHLLLIKYRAKQKYLLVIKINFYVDNIN